MPSFSPLLPPVRGLPSAAATAVKSALSLDSWYSSCAGEGNGRWDSALPSHWPQRCSVQSVLGPCGWGTNKK